MSGNKSIRDFFKPKAPASPQLGRPVASQPSSQLQNPPSPLAIRPSPRKYQTSFAMGQKSSRVSPSPNDLPSSSLSAPPSSDPSELYHTPSEEIKSPNSAPPGQIHQTEDFLQSSSPFPASQTPPAKPPLPAPSLGSEIQDSEDEDDSDSDLDDDISALLASRQAEVRAKAASNGVMPSTPPTSRFRNSINYNTSPLVVPKYKFDLNSLARHAQTDAATEAASKRYKAMTARKEDEDTRMTAGESTGSRDHSALLDSVVNSEDGGQKIKRAMERTEAIVKEQRWYFFESQAQPPQTAPNRPFPTSFIPAEWKGFFSDEQLRYHTFISGYAEDLVTFKNLKSQTLFPDEIFLWMLEQLCFEPSDALRNSYLNVLCESTEQIKRLLNPESIPKLFRNLGATLSATNVTEKISLVPKIMAPYPRRDWSYLLTIIKFLTRVSDTIEQDSKSITISLLLRLSIDRMVFENVDILDSVQKAIRRLCKYAADSDWEETCKDICANIFRAIDAPTLRLQVLESISSTTPRSHDLRRRLAMCFFFNNLHYSTAHSQTLVSLPAFIARLEEDDFEPTPQTDYHTLSALITLLDIAIDDGRSTSIDLTSTTVETVFNEDVDRLSASIKDIMRRIGNPGAAFISRIEAKEVLELVSQRVSDTVRTRQKKKSAWFEVKSKAEDLEVERRGMKSFVQKMKRVNSGADGT